MSNLKLTAVRGSAMMGGVTILLRPLNLITNIVLMRLLDPSDFGAVSLAMLLLTSSYLFAGWGMGPAIIHSNLNRGKVVYQAFVVTLLFGVTLFGLIAYFAQPLANFLGNPEIVQVVRVLSILVFLESMNVVPAALLSKDLRFGRSSIVNIIEGVVFSGMALLFAYLNYGMWSLIYARIISTVMQTMFLWLSSRLWQWLKPQPWDWSVMRSLLHYGTQSTSTGLLAYVHQNADDWIVGRFFGVTAYGFYDKAYSLSNSTLASLSRSMINTVFFPSYARIQEDKERLARVYMKSIRVVLMIVTPLALGMLVTAPVLVPVLAGEKWLPMVACLQVYSILVLTRPISSNTYPLFMGVGRPDYNTKAGLLLVVIMLPLAFLLMPWNIVGVAAAVVTAHTVAALYNIYQVNTILPGTAKQTAVAAIPAAVAGGVMAVVVVVATPLLAQVGGGAYTVATLVLLVLVAAVVYIVITFILQRALLFELWQLGTTAVGLKRKRRMSHMAVS
ncbi:MAG: lipopolysaccharide biosynthesis protein [Caldilineaceae bacterium]